MRAFAASDSLAGERQQLSCAAGPGVNRLAGGRIDLMPQSIERISQ